MTRLALLAIPCAFMFAVGCGGDTGTLGGYDLGPVTTQDMAPVTAFKILSGQYVTSSTMNVQDACSDPALTAADINGLMRTVTNDVQNPGTIMVQGWGTGIIDSNKGTLTLTTPNMSGGGSCTYDDAITSQVTVTADNTMNIVFTDNETNRTSSCVPAGASCTTSFTTTLTKM